MKSFNRITASLNLMLKTTTPSVPARSACIRTNENEPSIDDDDGIGGGRMDDKMANPTSSIKKMSSKAGFLTFKASLAFTKVKKAFTKILILYYFE